MKVCKYAHNSGELIYCGNPHLSSKSIDRIECNVKLAEYCIYFRELLK